MATLNDAMKIRSIIPLLAACVLSGHGAIASAALGGEPHTLVPDDYYRFLDVTEPQVAPDGSGRLSGHGPRARGRRRTQFGVARQLGRERGRPITQGESASHPRFSPDGRYVAFISRRPHDGTAQVWLLDRRGGEARQLTHVNGEISSYSVVARRTAPRAGDEQGRGRYGRKESPADRHRPLSLQARRGRLPHGNSPKHLYLVDVARRRYHATHAR
jgi:dipeptidyl aminopeptidase/acylaminoacyl peptidase